MLGLIAVLSGYLAALAWTVNRLGARGLVRWIVLLPAAWTLVEWLRGWVRALVCGG